MLFKAPFNIRRNARIKVALLTLNDINEPFRLFHASILTRMNRITIPFSEFSFSFSRSGGAGGQNVNKVNSKVVLEWNIERSDSVSYPVKERFRAKFRGFINDEGMVQITGQRHRSQKDNIDDCIQKLHEMLNEVLVPPKPRKATKPKRSAVLKRLNTKKKDSEKKRMRKSDY